jgi:hypothetical protein
MLAPSTRGIAMKRMAMSLLLLAAVHLAACEGMSPGQKGAATGAALGSGIGMVAGGSFGQVVGAGLIGGAAGYITGSAIGDR